MKRLLFYGLALVLLGFVLYQKRNEVLGIAAVLTFTAVFSMMLMPLCSRMERRGIRRTLAAGYAVIGFFLIVMVISAACIPYLISHSVYLIKRISPMAVSLVQQAAAWLEDAGFAQMYMSDQGSIIGMTISRITGMLAKAGMAFAAQTGRILFALVLTYYVLCDRKRVGNHLMLFVPSVWRRPVLAGIRGCRNAVMSYFSGLLKTSAFVSVATGFGLLLLGVEDAVLLALLMGALEMLPYFGPVLAAIPILLSSMTRSVESAIGALIVVVAVQQIEGSIVSPYFTASSTSIDPLTAVASVFIFGSIWGIWGILTAVPAMVLVQSILWSVRQTRYLMKEDWAEVR